LLLFPARRFVLSQKSRLAGGLGISTDGFGDRQLYPRACAAAAAAVAVQVVKAKFENIVARTVSAGAAYVNSGEG
jgi:hypothetical protein